MVLGLEPDGTPSSVSIRTPQTFRMDLLSEACFLVAPPSCRKVFASVSKGRYRVGIQTTPINSAPNRQSDRLVDRTLHTDASHPVTRREDHPSPCPSYAQPRARRATAPDGLRHQTQKRLSARVRRYLQRPDRRRRLEGQSAGRSGDRHRSARGGAVRWHHGDQTDRGDDL